MKRIHFKGRGDDEEFFNFINFFADKDDVDEIIFKPRGDIVEVTICIVEEEWNKNKNVIPVYGVYRMINEDKIIHHIVNAEDIDKQEIAKSVVLLDLFSKTYCRYSNDYERFDDLKFRCYECPFNKPNGDCLCKIFKNQYAPDYKDFGCMCDL